MASLPSWEAWIEVLTGADGGYLGYRRFPHGKRGLKFFSIALYLGYGHVASLMGSVD